MKINDILNEANVIAKYDKRNKMAKSIENAINEFGLEIDLCVKGKFWNLKTGKCTLEVKIKGAVNRTYRNTTNWSSETFLNYIHSRVGSLLLYAKEKGILKNNNFEECDKCGGIGKLRHYSYYAEGICFQCMGSGLMGKTTIVEINL